MHYELKDFCVKRAARAEDMLTNTASSAQMTDPEALLPRVICDLLHYMHREDMEPDFYIDEAISLFEADLARRKR